MVVKDISSSGALRERALYTSRKGSRKEPGHEMSEVVNCSENNRTHRSRGKTRCIHLGGCTNNGTRTIPSVATCPSARQPSQRGACLLNSRAQLRKGGGGPSYRSRVVLPARLAYRALRFERPPVAKGGTNKAVRTTLLSAQLPDCMRPFLTPPALCTQRTAHARRTSVREVRGQTKLRAARRRRWGRTYSLS